MTEAEWRACSDPVPMLEYVRDTGSVRAFRLFACACCRWLFHLVPEGRAGQSFACAERFALEAASRAELNRAYAWACEAAHTCDHAPARHAACAVRAACYGHNWQMSLSAALFVQDAAVGLRDGEERDSPRVRACRKVEAARQADLARHIFGNPFRPVHAAHWRTADVLRLAQSIYAERDLQSGLLNRVHLAVLADALEEAGADEEALTHLRSPASTHMLGCWVLELLLAGRADRAAFAVSR